MVLAVGYRVRSPRGIQFQQWATERLSEYRTALISAAVTGKIDMCLQVPNEREMESLRVFCEICDDIGACRFIRDFNKQDHTFRSTKNPDGTWTSQSPTYDDDDFRAFMTHFRKLFLQNENGVKTNIYAIIKILSRYGTQRDREGLKEIKRIIEAEKRGAILVKADIDGKKKTFTPGDIMDVIFKGDVFHSDAGYRAAMKKYRKLGWIMQAPFLRFALSVVNNARRMALIARNRYSQLSEDVD